MIYLDRKDAAAQLFKALETYHQMQGGIVLALTRGGVPVGRYIADQLHWPLDVVIIKKIGHPDNPEYALGAVSSSGYVINNTNEVPEAYFTSEIKKLGEVIKAKYRLYRGNRLPPTLQGRVVILVDDGMATGSSMLAAVRMTRKANPKKIVVAIPVASQRAYDKVAREADEVVCLQFAGDYMAVGQFYDRFPQVSDEEVITDLQ